MTDPQIPTPDQIISPGIAELVRLRPQAAKFLGTGVWSNVIVGLRAQSKLEIARLADAAKSGRLPLSEGAGLRELVASEFDILDKPGPLKAIGQVTLTRVSGGAAGLIPKGTKFRRKATTIPPILKDATFESVIDVYMTAGALGSTTIPLIAVTEGSFANSPRTTPVLSTVAEVQDTLFDTTLTCDHFGSAGGSDGASDDDLKQYAFAFAQGQYAPTDWSIIAGGFNAGVRHAKLVDNGLGVATLWIADGDWASTPRWEDVVKQYIYDNVWSGFGENIDVLSIENKLIRLTANVVVTSPDVLFDTVELEAAMQTAVRKYFDERPDFYSFKLSALRGVLAQVDRKKVLGCLSVSVLDLSGTPIAEPTDFTGLNDLLYHYMMADNPLTVSFTLPT